MQSKVSRRQLIAAGAVGAAVAATTSAAQAASKKPQFDKVYDVIVVGSGFAGLAAALESRLGGAEVLLIEKMPAFGGNSAINGGAFSVAGSPLQKKFGIKDSPEQMLADMIRSGRGLSHVDLLKMVVEGSLPAYEFTLRHGVKYKDFVQHFGGHSVPRTLQTVESTGGGITRPLTESCRKHGVELHLRAKMEEFIRDDDGRVVGLVVRERYLFPNEESGVLQRYGARKGVIMATGGFSRNIWFRRQQDPNLDERLDSTNHPGATGEGMLKMFAIGAAPVQVDQIQLGPWSSPDERGFGLVSQFNTIAGFPMGIMVDVRNGERFCNELADRKERTDAILGLMENGKPVYPVCFTDSKGVEKAQTLKNGLKYGVIKKFDKLEDLAKAYGIPVKPFLEQVAQWNSMVKNKKDTQFKRALDLAIVLDHPPFYACRVWPKVHYCMGGVGITAKAQVHDVMGKIIPGLFACGEVTGGMHGADRIGGLSTANGLVFGRKAGESAAAFAAAQPAEKADGPVEFDARIIPDQAERRHRMQNVMSECGMVVRTGERLRQGMERLAQLADGCVFTEGDDAAQIAASRRLWAQLHLAQAILSAQSMRTESRGSHYRADYPEQNHALERRILVRMKGKTACAAFEQNLAEKRSEKQ